MDERYFRRLRRAYDEFFTRCTERVHTIEADAFDWLHDEGAVRDASRVIDALLDRDVVR